MWEYVGVCFGNFEYVGVGSVMFSYFWADWGILEYIRYVGFFVVGILGYV